MISSSRLLLAVLIQFHRDFPLALLKVTKHQKLGRSRLQFFVLLFNVLKHLEASGAKWNNPEHAANASCKPLMRLQLLSGLRSETFLEQRCCS